MKWSEKTFWQLCGLVGGLFLLVFAVLLWQVNHRQRPAFFAVEPGGERMQLVPHEDPGQQSANLLSWASRAAVAAYTFNFVNYEKQAAIARQYFTDAGWADYQESLRNLVKKIVGSQLFVNGVVSDPPVIALADEQGWDIQIPFLVTYQSADQTSRKNFLVRMRVVRVSTLASRYGVGIDGFVMAASGRVKR